MVNSIGFIHQCHNIWFFYILPNNAAIRTVIYSTRQKTYFPQRPATVSNATSPPSHHPTPAQEPCLIVYMIIYGPRKGHRNLAIRWLRQTLFNFNRALRNIGSQPRRDSNYYECLYAHLLIIIIHFYGIKYRHLYIYTWQVTEYG